MTEAAIAELIEAAVRQLREEKDAAIEALTMIAELARIMLCSRRGLIALIRGSYAVAWIHQREDCRRRCGYSDEAVRGWAATGQVAGRKRGGRVCVELASVLERAGRRG